MHRARVPQVGDSALSATSLKTYGVALADMNADGSLDAMVVNYGEANEYYTNDGARL